MTQFKWDEAAIEKLTQMVAGKMSSGQIARELGITRNSVIGKIHRLGLILAGSTGRAAQEQGLAVARPRRARPVTVPVLRIARAVRLPPVEPAHGDASPMFLDLRRTSCRWPVGDATGAAQRFCGATADDLRPYCPWHAAKAIDPNRNRRA